MNGISLRTFMVAASRLGYTNGDFVFFGLDPFRDDILGKNGWMQSMAISITDYSWTNTNMYNLNTNENLTN